MSFKNSFALAPVLPLCAGIDYTQMQNAPRAEVAGIPVNYDEAKVGTYSVLAVSQCY